MAIVVAASTLAGGCHQSAGSYAPASRIIPEPGSPTISVLPDHAFEGFDAHRDSSVQDTLIEPVAISVVGIADSSSYFVYEYSVRNPTRSTAGIGNFRIDVTHSGSTPTDPPSTGLTKYSPLPAGRGRVPVGPVVPAMWYARMTDWINVIAAGSTDVHADSLAPGATLTGFAIRSPFLPGIREVQAEPTLQSCCRTLLSNPDTGMPCTSEVEHCQYPFPGHWMRSSWTTAPSHAPSEMNLRVLVDLLDSSCDGLSWISDSLTCRILRQRLDAAVVTAAASNTSRIRSSLDAFIAELDARHDPAGTLPVTDNAYWMLRTNALFLRNALPPARAAR